MTWRVRSTGLLCASLSLELTTPAGSGSVTLRADWSIRDDMFGEPSNDPARFTFIETRDLINAGISDQPADGNWTAGIYDRNITDKLYDNARLDSGDYVLVTPEQRCMRGRTSVHPCRHPPGAHALVLQCANAPLAERLSVTDCSLGATR